MLPFTQLTEKYRPIAQPRRPPSPFIEPPGMEGAKYRTSLGGGGKSYSRETKMLLGHLAVGQSFCRHHPQIHLSIIPRSVGKTLRGGWVAGDGPCASQMPHSSLAFYLPPPARPWLFAAPGGRIWLQPGPLSTEEGIWPESAWLFGLFLLALRPSAWLLGPLSKAI